MNADAKGSTSNKVNKYLCKRGLKLKSTETLQFLCKPQRDDEAADSLNGREILTASKVLKQTRKHSTYTNARALACTHINTGKLTRLLTITHTEKER